MHLVEGDSYSRVRSHQANMSQAPIHSGKYIAGDKPRTPRPTRKTVRKAERGPGPCQARRAPEHTSLGRLVATSALSKECPHLQEKRNGPA